MAGKRQSGAETSTSKYRGSDGRWHARVTVGRRLDGQLDRRHISRATKRDLDKAVRQLEHDRDAGQRSWLDGYDTLGEWLEHWLTAILPLSVRWKTLSTYRSLMRVHVIPAMGAARLTEVRPETLEMLYSRLLDEGHSTHVVHAVHRVLRSALGEAVRRRHLSQNPASVARPPRVPATDIEPLTSEECRALLEAARGTTNAARWSVALALGLRQGEALGLTWDDVDLERGVIQIRRAVQRRTWQHGCSTLPDGKPSCGQVRGGYCPSRKNGGLLLVELKTRASRRVIALPGPLLQELKAHRTNQLRLKEEQAVCDGTHNMVFATDIGDLIDPAADFRAWKKLLKRAGVREVRLHDARHTAATLLLVQGVDLRTVMAIMGWTEMATAQRYVHAVDELRREAARRMGDALWAPPPSA